MLRLACVLLYQGRFKSRRSGGSRISLRVRSILVTFCIYFCSLYIILVLCATLCSFSTSNSLVLAFSQFAKRTFRHRLLIFNHPRVITSFFPHSNFGSEPRFAKNCAKWQFWKGELNQKSAPSKFHIWGLYAIYGLCAILVLQSLSIGSSFSTIHVWLQASFPLQISVLSQDLPKTVQNDNLLKRRIEPKKRTFQIPHLGSICSIRYVCHRSVAEFGHSLLIFNHPRVITSFFPPSNFDYEFWAKIGQKLIKSCHFWKEELNQKKRTF